MTRRVVVSLLTEGQEYQRLQADDARASAARLGLELELLYADNDPALQLEQLSRPIRLPDGSRPAAIVAETVSGEGLECVARDAVAAGVGWLILNRDVPYLEALRRARPDLPVALVSTDQEEIGRIQGRQFRTLLPHGGAVLYVQGPPDT